MAKKGGVSDGWALGTLIFAGAALLYAYSKYGVGKENSALIPDALEDRIDRVVEALNQRFGQRWVTAGLHHLRGYIEQTMPAVAGLVNALYQVEQAYSAYPGRAKKQAALRLLGA